MMEQVKIKKSALVKVVQENRKRHRAIFLEAVEGYREQVIAELDAMLREAKNGKRIRRMVNLTEPVDQTKEYDRVLKMLEMSVDKVIALGEHEFACYVMDDWQWKQQFAGSNVRYLKTQAHIDYLSQQ